MNTDCTILCCRTGGRHYSEKNMNELYEMPTEEPQVCLVVNIYSFP